MDKDNILIRSWNKLKQKVNDCILENNIAKKFNNDFSSFSIYLKDCLISKSVCGYFSNEKLIVYGEHLDKINAIIINTIDKKTFFIVDAKPINITINYNNIDYVRLGTIFSLDEKVEEVNVIKAGKKYYKVKE